jgi:hypothetical protein
MAKAVLSKESNQTTNYTTKPATKNISVMARKQTCSPMEWYGKNIQK